MAKRSATMAITSNCGLMMTYRVNGGMDEAKITIQRPGFGSLHVGLMMYECERCPGVKKTKALSFDPAQVNDGDAIASRVWMELERFYKEAKAEMLKENKI